MKKILIVEDDSSIAMLQKDYLEIAGYDITICEDGLKGLEAIRNNEYDLIILDVMLPGLDGFDVLRKIRPDTDIPVLMVSARQEDVDKIRGLGLGADDYISKPFSPGELVARVNAHIAKYDRLKQKFDNAVKPVVLSARGLELHKDSHRVFHNGREITLAAKEFEILQFLMSNPDMVFSRDDLFEKIWGLESFGDVATVTVHIAKLREKIEPDSTKPQYVETVWGAGYRFKA